MQVAKECIKPHTKKMVLMDNDISYIIRDIRNQEKAINDLLKAVFKQEAVNLEPELKAH